MKKPIAIEILVFVVVLMLGAIYLAITELVGLKILELARERGLIEPDFESMPHARNVPNSSLELDLDLSGGIKEPK